MPKPKADSMEVFRFENGTIATGVVKLLKSCLNTAHYNIRVRGRKPDNDKMNADGLRKGCFGSDGNIPLPYAKEVVVYVNGITAGSDQFYAMCESNKEMQSAIGTLNDQVKEWSEKYQQSQAMVMELEDALHHHSAERQELVRVADSNLKLCNELQKEMQEKVAELQQAKDSEQWEANQYSQAKKRLIHLASQAGLLRATINDLENNEKSMHERLNHAQDEVNELKGKLKRKDKVLEMRRKLSDKYRKYHDFFHMLKELKGVDVTITDKRSKE